MAFERNFNQLRVYYTDARGLLPPSDQEALLLSLNLLRCGGQLPWGDVLASGRTGEPGKAGPACSRAQGGTALHACALFL